MTSATADTDGFDLRRVLGWAGLATGVALTTFGAVTYAAVRTLTDAPRGARRARGYHLVARFDAEHRDVVFVRGNDADRPGTWGLVHPDGYAQVGDVLRQTLTDDDLESVRPYELLDGRVPPPEDRRLGDRRVLADRRSGDRRTEPEVTDEVEVDPSPVTPRRRTAVPRRRPGDRRRSRDRRREHHPPPWPVPGRWSDYAFPDDPQILAELHGADFELDCVNSPSGACLPAWRLIPEEASDTWMVAVHGRGAPRAEVYRLVDTALSAGIPCLVVSYRTDRWTHDPAPLSTLGSDEWEDVAAAMRQLIRDGGRQVVLAGCSLGGAICAQVVRRSAMAPYVVGVILDSPALSWAPILAHVARGRRLPTALVPPVMAAARVRAKLDWQSLDLLAAADDLRTPILLIHGTEDEAVPVWLSDQFAEARPDLVTYLRVDGARHVECWNTARDDYVDAVTGFLDGFT